MKRAIDGPLFAAWTKTLVPVELTASSVETAGEGDLLPYLDRLFDRHIWTGKNSLSRTWILRRLSDGQGAIYPRDVVSLMREGVTAEDGRIGEKQPTSDSAVVSRWSSADALLPTSRQRVKAVEEEYPELRQALAELKGLSSVGKPDDLLARLRLGGIGAAEAIRDRLLAAGVLRYESDGSYRVPELYRLGLDMTRLGPR